MKIILMVKNYKNNKSKEHNLLENRKMETFLMGTE